MVGAGSGNRPVPFFVPSRHSYKQPLISDTEIDLFYDQLQDHINQLSSDYKFMILGDLNAKVGQYSYTNWPSVVGKYGIGTCNERREQLLQFCAINNLAIVNTMYKHKHRRLVTWMSPDGTMQNHTAG